MWGLLMGCVGGSVGLWSTPGPVPEGAGDTVEAPAIAPPPARDWSDGERPDAFLYADETLDFALELPATSIDALATSRTQVDDAPWVPATFDHGGERYPVTLRLKGGMGSFRRFDEKPSFKVDFAGVDPDARFHGARWLVLNNLVQDDCMLAEHAAYLTYGALGVPAGRHGYARVTVNGEWFGLYGIVEPIERDLVARYWPTDADGPILDGGVDLVPGDEEGYQVVQDGDMTPLYQAAEALDVATPDTYLATLDTWFEADRVLDMWAIELATGNPDAYVTRHNNYYLYWRAADAKWSMLPWGTDTAFLDPLELDEGWYEGALYEKCLEAPACQARLRERLADVTTWMETGALDATLRAVADRTLADCLADPRSEAGPSGCTDDRERFFRFLADRPAELRALLAE